MHRPFMRNSNGTRGAGAKKTRRPAGVSRRRKQQLTFETLEPRQVMSADVSLSDMFMRVNQGLQMQSYSTDTPEGAYQALVNELYWQSLIAANSNANAASASLNSIPTDPLLAQQWHLINTGQRVSNPDVQAIYGVAGQDINVAPVWSQGIFGNGVTVAVIDSGVQSNHPDLAANINVAAQRDFINNDNDASPNLANPVNAHGTAVAGLIGAVANNGIGGTGVAPGVTLVPIRLIDAGQTEQGFVNAFRYTINNGIDITNNSWGPGVVRGLAGPTAEQLLALRDSVIFGRGGKGVINVFSSGNDAGPQFNAGFTSIGGFDSAGYNGWINTRYTIAVTGVDHDGFYGNADGTVTAYPEAGANVFVAAPTGSNAGDVITNDNGVGSGLTTTDALGNLGFNAAPDVNGQETLDPFIPFDRDFLTDPDYTSRFNGTSSSAPLVSGVIALMLQANPNLTWRDVQEILVRSARQNAQFDVPTDQFTPGSATQNTWIINQMPIFQAPDPYDPAIAPRLQTLFPTLDPNIITQGSFDHSVPVALFGTRGAGMTNGAGYTVSQGTGIYGEQIGYGHGVIDAQLAVALAQQWSQKNQSLAAEYTFSTFVSQVGGSTIPIPAVEKGNQDSGYQVVPGKPGGQAGFIAFWNEYFADQPNFAQNFQPQGQDLFLDVPPPQTMSVETVEVKLSIAGGTAAALSNLRVMLVSPNGTQSELNNFWVDTLGTPFTLQNNSRRNAVFGDPGSQDLAGGNLIWTFTTNRNWGERSDDAVVYDATTGVPFVDSSGLSGLTGNGSVSQALKQGWRLVLENYSSTPLSLDGAEVVWHGQKIDSTTKRISGFVGVDQLRDDAFNFTRVTQTTIGNVDNDPGTLRYGEVQNSIDPNQEPFANNVTVTLRRTSDNAIVKQFVTGADGNFYFDVVPGDYIVSVQDPLGRTALDDTHSASGIVKDYQNQWHITPAFFTAWNKATVGGQLETPVNASGVPVAWLDGNGATTPDNVRNINFLLTPSAPEAAFSGIVYADLDSDGVQDAGEPGRAGVTVYIDADNDGVFDAGEASTVTNASGQYSLSAALTVATLVHVRVVPPAGWTATAPAGGVQTVFAQQGNIFANTNFGVAPPTLVSGTVFDDANGNGVQNAGELGLGNIHVYLDANNNGVFNPGERETTTDSNGFFVFVDVTPGTQRVKIDLPPSTTQTAPANNGAFIVSVPAVGVVNNVKFGVRSSAIYDFGDLPNKYHATLLNDFTLSPLGGARHTKGNSFKLGSVDAELDGVPSINADGDDLNGVADESGIVFGTLTAGGTGTLSIAVGAFPAYLQGWVDWNDDGDFNDAGERILKDRLMTSNTTNVITINVPAGAVAQPYARFRYGEFGIDSIFGAASIGEVEDYRLAVAVLPASVPLVTGIPADFDQDGDVDGADILIWQRGLGKTSGAGQAQGSADGDGDVDMGDLSLLRQQFGATTSPAFLAENPDFNGDGGVDGADLLAWQRGLGVTVGATLAQGDGNGDAKVDAADLAVWHGSYGLAASSSSVTAGLVASAASSTGDAAESDLLKIASRSEFTQTTARGYRPEARSHESYSQLVGASALRAADSASDVATTDVGRDRVFEDLYATRKQNAVRANLSADDSVEADDCDAALALLADYGQW